MPSTCTSYNGIGYSRANFEVDPNRATSIPICYGSGNTCCQLDSQGHPKAPCVYSYERCLDQYIDEDDLDYYDYIYIYCSEHACENIVNAHNYSPSTFDPKSYLPGDCYEVHPH